MDRTTQEERFKLINEKIGPLWKDNSSLALAPELIKKESDNLDKGEASSTILNNFLHSEEALIIYLLGSVPILPKNEASEGDELLTIDHYLKKIKIPQGCEPELCILSMVSKNDSCAHCRPMLAAVSNADDFLRKNLEEQLKVKVQRNQIVLFYSAVEEFSPKRPPSNEFK